MEQNVWAEEVAAMPDGALRNELAEVLEIGFAPKGWKEALMAEFEKRGI